jgi:CBS domain-containing protein
VLGERFEKGFTWMFIEQMLSRARERLATIGAGARVREAADLMLKPHTDLVVVCDYDGGMVGVVYENRHRRADWTM